MRALWREQSAAFGVQIEDSRRDLETSTNQNESFMDETTSPEELSGKATDQTAEAKQTVVLSRFPFFLLSLWLNM